MSVLGFHARNHPQQTRQRGESLFPDLESPTDDVDDRGTDPALFEMLDRRFGGFTVDVAAAAHNAKCERFYDLATDGLAQSWAGERVWCNPPYSNILPWVHKAWQQVAAAEVIVMLLPANRTEQPWWQEAIEPFRDRAFPQRITADGAVVDLRVEFLPGRPRFVQAPGKTADKGARPPFGCCLLVFLRF